MRGNHAYAQFETKTAESEFFLTTPPGTKQISLSKFAALVASSAVKLLGHVVVLAPSRPAGIPRHPVLRLLGHGSTSLERLPRVGEEKALVGRKTPHLF